MNVILITLAVALISWLILGGIFFAYPAVQRLKHEQDQFGLIVKIPIYMWFVLGYLADVGFNATWGTVIFRELPRELVFTSRLKRHWHGTDEKQKQRAAAWVRRVNLIDPGHV